MDRHEALVLDLWSSVAATRWQWRTVMGMWFSRRRHVPLRMLVERASAERAAAAERARVRAAKAEQDKMSEAQAVHRRAAEKAYRTVFGTQGELLDWDDTDAGAVGFSEPVFASEVGPLRFDGNYILERGPSGSHYIRGGVFTPVARCSGCGRWGAVGTLAAPVDGDDGLRGLWAFRGVGAVRPGEPLAVATVDLLQEAEVGQPMGCALVSTGLAAGRVVLCAEARRILRSRCADAVATHTWGCTARGGGYRYLPVCRCVHDDGLVRSIAKLRRELRSDRGGGT